VRRTYTCTILVFLACSTHSYAQVKEQSLTREASIVLSEITRVADKGIPTSLMQEAQAIMIFPEVIKAGFIVGARRGHGVVLMRNEQGLWGYPVTLTITGGSIGGQIGIQSTDLVLMFKSKRGVESILRGKHLTLGADASVSAGPVGRTLAASTDTSFRTEILSWSRSRGLFAGVAVDGSKVKMDASGTAAFYTTPNAPAPAIESILNGQVQSMPAVANDLRNQLNQLAPPPQPPQPPKGK
jgi:SH3 domain-containing YSC84-like protein 1